jgi:protein associated with RNAse G/E
MYLGQTVRFIKRYYNHRTAWKNNKPLRSDDAKLLLGNEHTLSTIDEDLKIFMIRKKGVMNAWEQVTCKNGRKL